MYMCDELQRGWTLDLTVTRGQRTAETELLTHVPPKGTPTLPRIGAADWGPCPAAGQQLTGARRPSQLERSRGFPLNAGGLPL